MRQITQNNSMSKWKLKLKTSALMPQLGTPAVWTLITIGYSQKIIKLLKWHNIKQEK